MVKQFNLGVGKSLKNKTFISFLKIAGIFILAIVSAFIITISTVSSASLSDGGVYSPYQEPEPFDPGFDFEPFECNCDYDEDDDNDNNNDDEPDATTRSASSVGDNSATLNARVDGNGSSTRAWFEYGEDRDLDDTTSQKSIGSGATNFSIKISGLEDDTTYYFRVIARNDEGTDAGSIMSFRTDGGNGSDADEDDDSDFGIPTAVTGAATFVTTNSAQLNSVIRDSGNNRTNTWFEWGTTPSLGNKTQKILADASPSFTNRSTIVGLTPGVRYYFRAVAENEDWRGNGAILNFITAGGTFIPPVVTPPANTGGTVEETPAPAPVPTPTPVIEEEPEEEDKVGLEANVLGFGFFPTTLIGWMAFILLVLAIYILGRKYLYPEESDHVTVKVHDHHHH